MIPTDFSNDQNIMRRIIYDYIYTLKIKILIRNKT